MRRVLLLLLACLHLSSYADNPNCTWESACSCDLKGAWQINLVGFVSVKKKNHAETVGSDANTYRFYPCGVMEQDPWGNGKCALFDTMCMQSMLNGSYYSLGETTNSTVKKAVSNGIKSYLIFEYKGGSVEGNNRRGSTVKVICSKNEMLTYLNEDPALVFNLVLNTPRACPYYDRMSAVAQDEEMELYV